jgi:hypothetical protein
MGKSCLVDDNPKKGEKMNDRGGSAEKRPAIGLSVGLVFFAVEILT